MCRSVAAAAALLVLAIASGGVGAQGTLVPAGTLPVTPDPAECGIPPRKAEELAALLGTPVAGAAATPFAPPAGEAADGSTVAFVAATVREALACGNAAGYAGAASLVSDDALAGTTAGAGAGAAEVLTFRAEAAPPVPEERRFLLGLREVRNLGDGRVGALVVVGDPTRSPEASSISVVLAAGAEGTGGSEQYLYLIDEVAPAPDGRGGGTPTA